MSMALMLSNSELDLVRDSLLSFMNSTRREGSLEAVFITIEYIIDEIGNVTFDRIHKSENQSANKKPDVKEMYEHDITKGGARQDTYINPKDAQLPGLWPGRRLHVAEIRRGNIRKVLNNAYGRAII